jgi:hypothetical protein
LNIWRAMPAPAHERIYTMTTNPTVTKAHFTKRLADLCLKSGLADFPKDRVDEHILLKSAVLMIGPADNLTEKEVNSRLEAWIDEVSQIKFIDHITLRRRLVDTGYLIRSKDGASYQVVRSGTGAVLFDPDIEGIDPVEVILNAREEIARRKREYMERSKKG